MKLRKLGRTDLMVSEIGFGCTYFRTIDDGEFDRLLTTGIAAGMNIMDVCISEPGPRDKMGKALQGRRDKLILQGHIGLTYEDGQYSRTQDLAKSVKHLEDLYERLETNYLDIAMLHCIDTVAEYEEAVRTGLIDYMLEQKQKGIFRYLGFSSHDPETSMVMVNSGHFDVVMFSINPLFDLVLNDMKRFFSRATEGALPSNLNVDAKRAAFYALCEEKGVGITVMKGLGAGTLVNPDETPFASAMTVSQCVHYALNRPGVGSVLIGLKTEAQLIEALHYFDADASELDYSEILASITGSESIRCLYCNHCLPCPSKIDIGAVTRLLDSGKLELAEGLCSEYSNLKAKASQCVECGACMTRCPFGIDVVSNMEKAAAMFE